MEKNAPKCSPVLKMHTNAPEYALHGESDMQPKCGLDPIQMQKNALDMRDTKCSTCVSMCPKMR